jgi:cysteine desulfurase
MTSAAQQVYLDHNATTPVLPAVAAAMVEALARVGNPSSVHGAGRAARQAIDEARRQVATLVGAPTESVVFTSGGTEANNLALVGAGDVVVSAIEHDSVLRAVPDAARVPVTAQGVVDPAALDAQLGRAKADIVSVMLANNETGAIQPVAEIAAVAHRHGALVHCDAIQAAGRIDVDFETLGVDLMSLSAHKLGGPMGVGALLVRPGVAVAARALGGGQESWRRAGTENVPGIVGFGVAAAAARHAVARMDDLRQWRDAMEAKLRAIAPEIPIYGAEGDNSLGRLANTSCVGMPGVKGETQVMGFDLAGIAVSAGSACSSGKVTPSAVLAAMGIESEAAGEAIRVSLGWTTQPGDIDRFVEAWGKIYDRTRRREAA